MLSQGYNPLWFLRYLMLLIYDIHMICEVFLDKCCSSFCKEVPQIHNYKIYYFSVITNLYIFVIFLETNLQDYVCGPLFILSNTAILVHKKVSDFLQFFCYTVILKERFVYIKYVLLNLSIKVL